MMSLLKVYWKSPFEGASPRDWLKVRGVGGRVIKISGVEVAPGIVKYEAPDTEDNRIIISGLGSHYTEELPTSVKPSPPKPTKAEPKKPEVKKPLASPSRRLTKIEVMDMLSKAGVRYRTNEKPETLWEKLPDDVKRNFKLDQS